MIAVTSMASMVLAGCHSADTQEGASQISRTTEFADSSRQFTPEIMWQMGRIGAYHLSADAQNAVYGVTYYSVEQNKSRSVIYASTPSSKNTATLLTETSDSEFSPSFIPGTNKVAYLAADKEGVSSRPRAARHPPVRGSGKPWKPQEAPSITEHFIIPWTTSIME